jgi:cytochrome oxidase Cu insertion factor (SCO1/SenC/PrrC family)
MKTSRRHLRFVYIIVAAVAVAACSATTATPNPTPARSALPSLEIGVVTPLASASATYHDPIPAIDPNPTLPPWEFVPLTDVNTGQTFQISDFKGKVVLIETMATWCPTCQGEMSQVKDLLAALGPNTDLIAISLDVDPNEDAALLKKYAVKNGFDWRIAIAPIEIGRFLSMNYDEAYLNPPEQGMLYLDRQGGVWGLPFGIKSAISLQKTLEPVLAAK